MELTPLEIVKRQQQGHKQTTAEAVAEFEADRSEKSIQYFHQVEKTFMDFITKNNYPFADVMSFEGKEYVGYLLFGTHTLEGDTYYDNAPFTLLIDEHIQPKYIFDTRPTGYFSSSRDNDALNEHAEAITIPTSHAGLDSTDTSESKKFYYTNLLKSAAYMTAMMKRFQDHGEDKDAQFWVQEAARRRTDYEDSLTTLFPEGDNIYVRHRSLVAKGLPGLI